LKRISDGGDRSRETVNFLAVNDKEDSRPACMKKEKLAVLSVFLFLSRSVSVFPFLFLFLFFLLCIINMIRLRKK
jgi:hypothetical protein